ncbi:hypothetical protein [Salinarimonas rosea]|uniref:hypothetical protein n=1 Tax=Salinarimonas rosea TaxID=552063 RepID=UPI000412D049|nr:hypothetical protein [Salinarimonas rosea]
MRPAAPAAAAPALAPVRWRGIGLPAACLALGLCAGLLALAIWSRTLIAQDAPSPGAMVALELADRPLVLPRDWLIEPRTPGATERVAIEAPLRALLGAEPSPAAGPRIGITLVPADDAPPPSERPAQLYNRFLEPGAEATRDGLIRRVFARGSPYEGETLHLAPPQGRAFAARCLDGAAAAGVRLPCLAEIRRGGLDVQVRLPAAALTEWPRIVAAVERLAAGPGRAALAQ